MRSKPGHRIAQRVELVSAHLVPSTVGSVIYEMAPLTTRRIVTGHDADGKAVFDSDQVLTAVNPLETDGSPPTGTIPGFTTICKTDGVPASVLGPFVDLHGKKIGLVDPSGVYCRIVDFPAIGDTPEEMNIMHRTQSLDVGVVLKGTIQLILDDGAEKTMNEGDVVVQRATIHVRSYPISYYGEVIVG